VSLTLLLVGCLASLGALMLLGHHAGHVWAEEFRQSFRHTMLWRLASLLGAAPAGPNGVIRDIVNF
jgi:hypothetical protein